MSVLKITNDVHRHATCMQLYRGIYYNKAFAPFKNVSHSNIK